LIVLRKGKGVVFRIVGWHVLGNVVIGVRGRLLFETRLSLGTWKFDNVESEELWGLDVMGCLSMISGMMTK
jgi:hypothetical protein